MNKLFLSLSLLLFSTFSFGWWNTGHATVCQIAENHLTPEVKAEVDRLLDNKSFAESCNWPDYVRPNRDNTFPWHFVNIPKSKLKVEASDCPPESCVLEAIQMHIRLLRNKKLPDIDRAESLMFLGHFIGDIHQPLHVGEKEDKGGSGHEVNIDQATQDALNYQGYNEWLKLNKLQVHQLALREPKYPPHIKKSNMHSIWDGAVLQHKLIKDDIAWYDYADDLAKRKPTVLLGNPVMWAQESKDILGLHSFGYNVEIENIDAEYLEHHLPVLEQRLVQAGYRLATILNQIIL